MRGLRPGETVLLDLRPHPKALVLPVLGLLLVLGGAGFAAARAPEGPLRLAVGVGALLLVLRLSLLPFLRWRATRCVLTADRLLLRRGVLRRDAHDVPLVRVVEVRTTRTLRQRLTGCGDLWLHPDGGPELQVRELRGVEAVRQAVQRAVDRS